MTPKSSSAMVVMALFSSQTALGFLGGDRPVGNSGKGIEVVPFCDFSARSFSGHLAVPRSLWACFFCRWDGWMGLRFLLNRTAGFLTWVWVWRIGKGLRRYGNQRLLFSSFWLAGVKKYETLPASLRTPNTTASSIASNNCSAAYRFTFIIYHCL